MLFDACADEISKLGSEPSSKLVAMLFREPRVTADISDDERADASRPLVHKLQYARPLAIRLSVAPDFVGGAGGIDWAKNINVLT